MFKKIKQLFCRHTTKKFIKRDKFNFVLFSERTLEELLNEYGEEIFIDVCVKCDKVINK